MSEHQYWDYLFNVRPDQGSKIILETLQEFGINLKGHEICKSLEKVLQGHISRLDYRLESSKIEIEADEAMELNIIKDGKSVVRFDASVIIV